MNVWAQDQQAAPKKRLSQKLTVIPDSDRESPQTNSVARKRFPVKLGMTKIVAFETAFWNWGTERIARYDYNIELLI